MHLIINHLVREILNQLFIIENISYAISFGTRHLLDFHLNLQLVIREVFSFDSLYQIPFQLLRVSNLAQDLVLPSLILFISIFSMSSVFNRIYQNLSWIHRLYHFIPMSSS